MSRLSRRLLAVLAAILCASSCASSAPQSPPASVASGNAPPDERLRQLIAREKAMPAALAEARTNLQNPPRVYTEIAIEQMDGNRGFFETAVASAFPTVTDKALLADYKKWLQDDLLKRSNGTFAIGDTT